jgi:hypothetical protein
MTASPSLPATPFPASRLIERDGYMTLIDLRERLTADCPKLKARNFED